MIDKETVDKIFDAADIVAVVSDFVHLKKRGVNYVGCCPFHNEKTGSFTVSPSKGIFKCFGCGKGGNSVNFIMEHEHLSYSEALKYLAKKFNIEVAEKELTPEQREQQDSRESMLIVNTFALKTFVHNLFNTDEGRAVGLSYFNERGFTTTTVKKFELGYCRKTRDNFTQLALQAGYKEQFLVSTGLTIKRDDGTLFDRFSERVMFPIHNLMGKVIAFGGRTLRTDKNIAKYLNSPESEVYHKSNVLYGIYQAKQAIQRNNKCFLVEGYTDVISMHQAGIENVVASSGTALTVEQIRLIKRFTPNITVLYDGDAAGIKAALRGIDMVLEEGMNVKVVLLPDGDDPDSFARKNNATGFFDFISTNETDFIAFKTKLLLNDTNNDPVKRAALITDIVKSIASIPDQITRSVYIKECSQLLTVDEAIIYNEINKIQTTKIGQTAYAPAQQQYKAQPIKPLTSAQTDKFALYEKEIIRVLVNYGQKILFTIAANNNNPEQQVLVSDYIIREVDDEIEIKTPVYQLIYREYKQIKQSGSTPPPTYFTKHENIVVSQTAADILATSHNISKMWGRKGSYINTEEDNLKDIIDNAINGYKYETIMVYLKDIEDEMKNLSQLPDNETRFNQLYEKYMAYTQFKIEIAKALGERTVLKR